MARMACAPRWMMPFLLAAVGGLRGGSYEASLEGAGIIPPTTEARPQGAGAAPALPRRFFRGGAPPGGESLVMCRGPQVCRGLSATADGLRTCPRGLYCRQAWILEADEAVETQEGEGGRSAAAGEAVQGEKESEELTGIMGEFEEELRSLAAGDVDNTTERVYACPGTWECSGWGMRGGRRWCRGGYVCRSGGGRGGGRGGGPRGRRQAGPLSARNGGGMGERRGEQPGERSGGDRLGRRGSAFGSGEGARRGGRRGGQHGGQYAGHHGGYPGGRFGGWHGGAFGEGLN